MHKNQNVINLGIGSVFIIAAILKLISIDEFEIYIYSFNIFSFSVTTIVSRLIIAGEFIFGLFLVLKIYYNFTRKAILSILILFILFLTYTAIFRDDDNCHCFGELVKLNPIESIVKNAVIIILLSVSNQNPKVKSQKLWLPLLIINCILLTIFVISPPDSIYKMIYSTEKEVSSVDLYESFDNVDLMVNGQYSADVSHDKFILDDEKQMIVVVSAGCKYCRIGLRKLSLMMNNKEIDLDKVNVFIWGSPEGIEDFRKETNTENYSYWHIMPNEAIDITYGRFPIFIWLENKEIVKVGDFRELTI